MADLTGPRAKTKRANKHIGELEAAVGGLVFSHTEDPHVIGADYHHPTGHKMYTPLKIPPVPCDVAPIAGDAIHNLHSALDLLMTQLVERAGNMPANRVTPYFPSGDSRESLEARLTPKIEALIGKDALDHIRAAEPYRGGKGGAAWYIHHLDVEDKHRVVYDLAISIDSHTVPLSWSGPGVIGDASHLPPEAKEALLAMANQTFFNFGGPIFPVEEGVPVLIVPGEPENDPKFRFEVTFAEPEIVKAKPVLPTLMEYAEATTALVESFAPLF